MKLCSECGIADEILNTQQLYRGSLRKVVYTQDLDNSSKTDREAGRRRRRCLQEREENEREQRGGVYAKRMYEVIKNI